MPGFYFFSVQPPLIFQKILAIPSQLYSLFTVMVLLTNSLSCSLYLVHRLLPLWYLISIEFFPTKNEWEIHSFGLIFWHWQSSPLVVDNVVVKVTLIFFFNAIWIFWVSCFQSIDSHAVVQIHTQIMKELCEMPFLEWKMKKTWT